MRNLQLQFTTDLADRMLQHVSWHLPHTLGFASAGFGGHRGDFPWGGLDCVITACNSSIRFEHLTLVV